MSGGGKGGSETSKVEIPAWIEEPSKRAIQRGEDIAQMGYVPYMGPDVAAMTPLQQSAMSNTAGAANAFGMFGAADPFAGLAPAHDYGGVMGHSSYPIFDQARADHAAMYPGQADYMANFFIDPVAGTQAPVGYGEPVPQVPNPLRDFEIEKGR